ncbi:MAG: ABC transporter substrate-binding protein [Deltaproteobacteria bacterium]|nr:ABC transporter substrate-binding protein [Deltaproteobacteria bacterium]
MTVKTLLRGIVWVWAMLGLLVANVNAQAVKPEKKSLEIAVAAFAHTTMPLLIAHEAGYFAKYGLSVNISAVSAGVAVQGLLSSKIDIYQGGSAAMMATLAGADIIYVAAGVDKSSLMLFGQKGVTTFEALRGKTVATTSPGAFGEIAMRGSARKYGMEIPKDIKLMFHGTPAQAYSTFTLGNSDAMINTPPQADMAKQNGYPVIVDYYKEGLKIIGPGTAVTREFTQKNPNTVKAFLMGLLDGVKRAIDDEAYASKLESKYSKLTDAKILADNYQQGLRVWNKDMTIDPAAIRAVLDDAPDGKGKGVDPKRFYDNSFIQAVNRDHASKLFPADVK